MEGYMVGLALDIATCSGSQVFSQMRLRELSVGNEQHLTEAPFTLKSHHR